MKHRAVLVILAALLVATAPSPTLRASTREADDDPAPSYPWLAGPDTALPPSENWMPLPPGETHWYAFDYRGHLEPGAGNTVWVGSQIYVSLDAEPDRGAAFSIWTPDQVGRWRLGQEVEPVGRGTRNAAEPGDLFWSGSFAAPGRYYLVVEHRGSGPTWLTLTIRSKGVLVPAVRDTAQALREAGHGAVDTADALVVLGLDAPSTCQVLKEVGYPAADVGQALKGPLGLGAPGAARLLQGAGFSAEEVGLALKQAFGLLAESTARVLKEVGFSAREAGLALKRVFDLDASSMAGLLQEVFGLDARATSRLLKEAGFAAGEVGLALKDVFALDGPAAARILKGVHFRAAETYVALKVVYGLHMDSAEEILVSVGYSEDEAFEAVKDDLLAWYAGLNAQFGPVLYLHPEERFLPSSVEWFLGNTRLLAQLPGQVESRQVSPASLMPTVAQLQESGATRFWFGTAGQSGELSTALSYVHAVRLKGLGKTDLQYWFFYPYNGPGTVYTRIGEFWEDGDGADDHGNFAPAGEHTGDWEAVFLRFDNATGTLDGAYMSQHGTYQFYGAGQLEYENGHVVSYSSLNGHANFPVAGKNAKRERHDNFGAGHFDLDTLNWTGKGKRLPAYERNQIVAVDDHLLASPWIDFPGRWGPALNLEWSHDMAYEIAYDHFAPAALIGDAAVCWICGGWLSPFCYVCVGAFQAVIPVITNAVAQAVFDDWDSDGPSSPAQKGTTWMYAAYPDEPEEAGATPPAPTPTPTPPAEASFPTGPGVEALLMHLFAASVGVTDEELEAALKAGQTLCDIAQADGRDLVTAWSQAERARETILKQATADGVLSEKQAETLSRLLSQLDPVECCDAGACPLP